MATSWAEMSSAARETLVSEQTANARRSSWVWAVHSRRVCDSSEIEGTRNSIRADAAVLGGGAFGDLQRGEGLAGAAGHDQLAAVVAGGEAVEDGVDRLLLVRACFVRLGWGER